MQRVTKRNSNGQYYMDGDGIFSDWGTPEKFMGDDVDTIAAIEDILGDDYNLDRLKVIVNQRMTMREEVAERFRITKDVPVERLKELVEADRDGRCVVLPCSGWMETVFGDQETFYGIDHDYLENPVREISVDSSDRCTWYDGWKTVVIKGYDENGCDWEFSPEELGKTVFLNPEAAEAALRGGVKMLLL